MVDITKRVKSIKALVDDGKYFSITKACQYGKTTTLRAVAEALQGEYYYINRDLQATFKSVILAGVYDIKNLRRKIREDMSHKVNSNWNYEKMNDKMIDELRDSFVEARRIIEVRVY